VTERDLVPAIVGHESLLEADPELQSLLTPEEQSWLARLQLPVIGVEPGQWNLEDLLRMADGFGVIVLDGMLLRELRVGGQAALWLLGPGDFLARRGLRQSDLLHRGNARVIAPTRLLLLGAQAVAAARRAPGLLTALQIRAAEHDERLAAQMVICQMARVEDRVLAMLWLLAEAWGRVTPAGTALPVSLTHEVLGALVGARRSTVTLAVRELVERGAILRRADGWLLLEQLPTPAPTETIDGVPALIPARRPSEWQLSHAPSGPAAPLSPDSLLTALRALREEHVRHRRRVAANLEIALDARDRNRQLRDELRQRRLRNGLHHHDRA
jgi:CRP-like cAMP-binding protein